MEEILVNVTSDLTISGKFIAMSRAGLLSPLSSLIRRRTEYAADLSHVEEMLAACNHPAALAEFAVWCISKKKNFEPELRKKVRGLEERKTRLQKDIQQIDGDLAQFARPAEVEILDLTMTGLAPRVRLVANVQQEISPYLVARNQVITRNRHRPHQEICRVLDFEFASGGKVPGEYFPESWSDNFGVGTFLAAYRDPGCRKLVQKMISTEKLKGPYLSSQDRQRRGR